jgi:hypothetical protein
MQIICHRINTIKELLTIPEKYGVEIDIRAFGTKLILNHEPNQYGDLLEEYLKHAGNRFIVFNVKEAGIEQQIIDLVNKYNITNYFLLDVEFPFIYQATRNKNFKKIAIRFSEAEPIENAILHKDLLDWCWIDTNTILPLNPQTFQQLKQANLKTCLVCPERWNRQEDIQKYIGYMKTNNLSIDAVMTNKNYIELWETILPEHSDSYTSTSI